MDVSEVEKRVAEIEEAKLDYEKAHALEDELYIDVMEAIAEGADNPLELAKECIKSAYIDFERYCA